MSKLETSGFNGAALVFLWFDVFFTNDVAILTLVPIVFNIDRKVKLPKIGLISLMTIYAT